MSRGFGTTLGVGTTDVITTRVTTSVTKNFSLSIWSNRNGGGGGSLGRMWSKVESGTTSDSAFYTNIGSNVYEFQWTFTATGQWTIPIPSASVWHHFLITYDPSSVANIPTIYMDGVQQTVTSIQPTGTVITSANPHKFGNRGDGIRNWDGLLAHTAIWNGVLLTAADALALYSGTNPLLISPNSLLLYLPIDGVNNPEIDYMNGNSSAITGTKLGVSEPPVMPVRAIRNQFDYFSDTGAGVIAYNDPLWFGMTA